MTQPEAAVGGLDRRVWILPVWAWGVVIVLAVVAVMWWRNRKSGKGASSANSSTAAANAGLTTQSVDMLPWLNSGYVYTAAQPAQPGVVDTSSGSSTTSSSAQPAGTTTPTGTAAAPGSQTNTTASNTPTPAARTTSMSYTIQPGDTLWAIASSQYGNGSQYSKILQANQSTLDAVAVQHGFNSSDSGHWIFPGTNILIPQ